MVRQPISMSIASFEKLITILNNTTNSIIDLYDKKEEASFGVHGDWNTYLKIEEGYETLPIILENERKFYRSMNVDIDNKCKIR